VSYYWNNVCVLLCYQQDFGSRHTSPQRPQLDDNTSYDNEIKFPGRTERLILHSGIPGNISYEAAIRHRNGCYTSGCEPRNIQAEDILGLIRHNGIYFGWNSGLHLTFYIDGLVITNYTVAKVWQLTAQAYLKGMAPVARFPSLVPVPFHINHLA
jgi:hypothetical protein